MMMNKNNGKYLDVTDLSHLFTGNEKDRWVLRNTSFNFVRGEFVCLVGRSGCGKSTLLNILAGFMEPTSGSCMLDGLDIDKPGPDRCVVFQEDALFPWLTVRENIAFGLKYKGQSRKERNREADRFLDLVNLEGYGDYLPSELSGGMKQRVALARVLILSPRLLLLDEPFAALDAQIRENIQKLLLRLWSERRQTILFITHDIEEAITLADRILLLGENADGVRSELTVDLSRPRDRESMQFQSYCRRLRTELNM